MLLRTLDEVCFPLFVEIAFLKVNNGCNRLKTQRTILPVALQIKTFANFCEPRHLVAMEYVFIKY